MLKTSRHAVIAGTGRAGTTFLVEFLGACGLDIGAAGDDGALFERARAGREIAFDESGPIPYVVKDPWLFEYAESIDLKARGIDVLIVPLRDLWDAAESRCHQERLRMVDDERWRRRPGAWAHGETPGGAAFSVEPGDQANVLARGLHELLFWAADNAIPVLMPTFPRMVTDADYLVESLWPWLHEHCDRERALAAFEATARPGEVSFGATGEAAEADRRVARAEAHARALATRLDEMRADSEARESELTMAVEQAQADTLRLEETVREQQAVLDALQEHLDATTSTLERVQSQHDEVVRNLETVLGSASWRATRPLRAVRSGLGGPASA